VTAADLTAGPPLAPEATTGRPVDLAHLAPPEPRQPGDADLLGELLGVIEHAVASDPRTLQRTIGPSGIGTACARRLAHELADTPRVRIDDDTAWLPAIGRAVHAFLAEVFTLANTGRPARWLVESRVHVGEITDYGDLDGNTDLYDLDTGTVIDWKIVGVTTLRNARAGRVGAEYRVQGHSYGLGWVNRGLPVRRVMIVFLPRNSRTVRDAVVWSERFDPAIAQRALRRAERVHALTRTLGLAAALALSNGALREAGAYALADPAGLAEDLAVPIADACRYCPWLAAGSHDLARACPGVAPLAPERSAPPTPAQLLAAGAPRTA
jgi:hypothetical protein